MTNQDLKHNIEQQLSKVLSQYQPAKSAEFAWKNVPSVLLNNNQPIQFNVIQKKEVEFKKQQGHIWYKNMNIPQLKVKSIQSGLNIQAKFLCLRQDVKSKNVQIIDLIGQCEQSLFCGECDFHSIRFPCTSYTHKGSRYFLGVCLVDQKNEYLVSDFMVSPSIYIESRKKAYLERQTYDSQFQVFTPSQLEKELVFPPQDEKLSKLYNFLTTPKIRLKIFNPLYLYLKFPETLKLYTNNLLIQEEQTLSDNDSVFTNLFNAIDKNLKKYKNKNFKCKMNEKVFIMTVNQGKQGNNGEVEKIMKLLNSLEGCVVTILSSETNIPQNFKQLDLIQENQENLYSIYRKNYALYQQQQQQNQAKISQECEQQSSTTVEQLNCVNYDSLNFFNNFNSNNNSIFNVQVNEQKQQLLNILNNINKQQNQNNKQTDLNNQDNQNNMCFNSCQFDLSFNNYPLQQRIQLERIPVEYQSEAQKEKLQQIYNKNNIKREHFMTQNSFSHLNMSQDNITKIINNKILISNQSLSTISLLPQF